MDRKTSIDRVIEVAKKTPGVGRYDSTEYDDKRNRPPRGIATANNLTADNYNFIDEVGYDSECSPSA